MACEQLEFPFQIILRPSRRRLPRSRKAIPRKSRVQLMTQGVKSKAVRRILAVVDAVSNGRGVSWDDVVYYHPKENAGTAEARELAMALCSAVEVPLCVVARLFVQPWAMVWEAEERTAVRRLADDRISKEWGSYLSQIGVKAPPTK